MEQYLSLGKGLENTVTSADKTGRQSLQFDHPNPLQTAYIYVTSRSKKDIAG
jgi:hypothetical protein